LSGGTGQVADLLVPVNLLWPGRHDPFLGATTTAASISGATGRCWAEHKSTHQTRQKPTPSAGRPCALPWRGERARRRRFPPVSRWSRA